MRTNTWAASLGLGILAAAVPALAQERPIIAVFQMEDRGSALQAETVANLGAYLEARLAEGGYQVIPQDQIRERIAAQKRGSYQACFDEGCQIELGRELAAQKILSTRILKIGDTCQVTSTLYDLKKAAADLAATAGGACQENALLGAVQEIARKLVEPLRAGGAAKPLEAAPPAPVAEPTASAGPAPAPAEAPAASRSHQAFFLRLCVGAGFARSATEGSTADKDSYVIGGGGGWSASAGYFIAPRVAVHADSFGITLVEPQNYIDGVRREDLPGQYTLGALGAGITWFFSPQDWFISAAAGLGVIRAKIGIFETQTKAGFAGNLLVGKQWWVSDDWSLGAAAQAMYGTVPLDNGNLQHTLAAAVSFVAAFD